MPAYCRFPAYSGRTESGHSWVREPMEGKLGAGPATEPDRTLRRREIRA